MTLTQAPDTEAETTGQPSVRFTQRERRGVFLGLKWPQLIVVIAVVAIVLLVLIIDGGGVAVWTAVIGLMIIAVAVWRYHGEPVITLMAQSVRYLARAAGGQTRFRRNVWWRITTTPLPPGNPPEMIPVPEVFRHETLPGGLGDIAYVDIPARAGGFIYNSRAGLASVTMQVRSTAWMLRDEGKKEGTYYGFAAWISSLETMKGLTEANLRVRVDRAGTTELTDYAAAQGAVRKTRVSDQLEQEYAELIRTEANRSMEFSNYITLTFDTRMLSTDIKDSGGGLAGLGAILTDRAQTLAIALMSMDVTLVSWLDAPALDEMTQTALDPVMAADRRERWGRTERETQSRPAVMAGAETPQTIHLGHSVHRTFWVNEWPRTVVKTGFLERLFYTGESTRVLCIQFRPVPTDKALNDLASAQQDMQTAQNIRERWGGRTSVQHHKERADLDRREEELSDGFTDDRFRAFLTISAPTEAGLRRDRSALEQAAVGCGLRVAPMWAQQWAALVTAATAIPTEHKTK
ncbi:SCO6880 family protein [Pseudactinotalea sp. Z1748]|uniref:SCO6880 family protein n=1 Tax=Pseudactinotalea sp. Z1748 TaxID=3413027 RepID=UPI003C7BD8E0